MPIGLGTLLFAISLQSSGPASPSNVGEIEALKGIRHEGFGPAAIVVAHKGASVEALAIYETSRGPEAPDWIVRRTRAGNEPEIASSRSCPQIYRLVLTLERLPIPSPEIRGPAADAPTGYSPPPPNLGPLHTRYEFWSRGWTPAHEPVELSLVHLGSGPVSTWMAEAETLLRDCWTAAVPDGERG
jgi:hypothetical protein